ILGTALRESVGHYQRRRDTATLKNILPDRLNKRREVPRFLLSVVLGNDQVVVWICGVSNRLVATRMIGINRLHLRAARRRIHDVCAVAHQEFSRHITGKSIVIRGFNKKAAIRHSCPASLKWLSSALWD